MARDLEEAGNTVVYEAAYRMTTLDLDTLREEAQEDANQAADNAVIYNSDALTIINEYASHPAASDAEDNADSSGQTFKPSDWQAAQTAYAYWIALAVIETKISEALDDLEAKANHLLEWLDANLTSEAPTAEDLTLSRNCPHGWAAHDREDVEGTHFWTSGQVDELNAVAIRAECGLWLSYTWKV